MKQLLTPREHEIFTMLKEGSAPKEIAYSLNISYETVLYHQKKLYRKLDVHSINELFIKYSPAALEPAKKNPQQEAADDANSNKIENLLREKIKTLAERRAFLQKIAVFWAFGLFIVFAFFHMDTVKGKMIAPNPMVITFTDDGPIGTDGSRGWQYIIDRDLFFYHGEWRKSPYSLKKERVKAGDVYDISCTFISDTDIGYLEAGFFDSLSGGTEGYYWTMLSGKQNIINNIEAGVTYNVSISMSITKTSSCDSDIANRFLLVAGPKTENIPTLTFTNFDIVKH